MPRVSVVIPAYYSQATLADCLLGLRAQTYRDFETILVNSSPEGETARVASRFPEVAFIQSAERLYPQASRNFGLRSARGDVMVFTDPDCRARPDWLARLLAAVDAGHGAVGGAILSEDRGWVPSGIHLVKFHMVLGGPARECALLPTANAAFSRRVFEAAGGLEGRYFCGDTLLSLRVSELGERPWLEPGAVVVHSPHRGVGAFLRQRYDRGHELAEVRARRDGVSRLEAAGLAAASGVRLAHALVMVGRNASQAGEGPAFVSTLPLQLAAQTSWMLGEAVALAAHATT